jgi:hypothetical protein
MEGKDPWAGVTNVMAARTVAQALIAERRRQDEKWGVQNHGPLAWLAILTEERDELNREVLAAHFEPPGPDRLAAFARLRTELIQEAAVAMAWLENMERDELRA